MLTEVSIVLRITGRVRDLGIAAVAASIWAGIGSSAWAQVQEIVILDNDGTNSTAPQAPLLTDKTGPSGALRGLYGTTQNSVYRLEPPKQGQNNWKDSTLWTYNNSGSEPDDFGYGALFAFTKRVTMKSAVYGTSESGGNEKYICSGGTGCGTVFSLTGHKIQKIWDFTGGSDGGQPTDAVITDKSGALYTDTDYGGGSSSCGTVVKLTPPAQGQTIWSESTLWTFTSGDDGCLGSGLIIDKAGAIFEVAYDGGTTGNGAVIALIPPKNGHGVWTEQTLWSFEGGPDGAFPYGPLLEGQNGVLFGTTSHGGNTGNGTVFSLTPPSKGSHSWSEQILWNFSGGADGGLPVAALIKDRVGALYGTAYQGGVAGCSINNTVGCGTVFKLTPPVSGETAWTETTLVAFNGSSGGGLPFAPLAADNSGVLYGTCAAGGSLGLGVVFSLTGTGFVP